MKKSFIIATVLLIALSASSVHAQQRITTQGGVQRLAAEVPTQASGQSMQLPSTRHGDSGTRSHTTLPAQTSTAPAYVAPSLSRVSRAGHQPTNMATDIASGAADTAFRTTRYVLRSQINRGISNKIREKLDF